MGTTKQNSVIDNMKIMRKVSENNVTGNHQTTKKKKIRKERNWEKLQNSQKRMNEMSIIVTISLNVNGLNSPIKRYIRTNEWKRKETYLYVAYKTFTSDVRADWNLKG